MYNRPWILVEKPPRPPITCRRRDKQIKQKREVRAAKKIVSRYYGIPISWVKVQSYKGRDIHFLIEPKMMGPLSFTINIVESETERYD